MLFANTLACGCDLLATQQRTIEFLCAAFIAAAVGTAFSDVVIDAIVIEEGQTKGRLEIFNGPIKFAEQKGLKQHLSVSLFLIQN